MKSTKLSGEPEAQISISGRLRGGWITFPFIMGANVTLALASGGWLVNLMVYLIEKFNVTSINAAQIYNICMGTTSFLPIVGGILADSCMGCFSVITVASCFSLLGLILFELTSTINSLKPTPCPANSTQCGSATPIQLAMLYLGIILSSSAVGGIRFTMASIGAKQFDKPKDQAIFFNWFFFAMYAGGVVSSTGLVYIQDNVSWGLGYGICIILNVIGLGILFLGKRFYQLDKPKGSPFTELARVIVAAIRKRKVLASVSDVTTAYYYEDDRVTASVPKQNFRFLNGAALKTEGDISSNGSIAKPWRLCTIEQVENFKTIIKLFPLWSAGIFLATPVGVQGGLIVLQALKMDRHIQGQFEIPAGSFQVVVLITSAIFLMFVDRFLFSLWRKLTGRFPTSLQRVAVGHVFNILSMAVSAIVENKRLKMVHSQQSPMKALWLFPQLVLVGIAEAFHFPGNVSLYYQEFPASLSSTATAMISMYIGIGFYLSTAWIDLVKNLTNWAPDNVDNGRLDNVYWSLVVIGVLNFGYFLTFAKLYKYQNASDENHDNSTTNN